MKVYLEKIKIRLSKKNILEQWGYNFQKYKILDQEEQYSIASHKFMKLSMHETEKKRF